MPISYLPYDLQEGYIHNWLVAGPQVIKGQPPESVADETAKAQVAQQYYEEDSGIHQLPVEPGPLKESTFRVGDYEGLWAYFPCAEDHFVDLTDFYPGPRYLRAWAYTQLVCEGEQTVSFILTTYGPADVWLNGARVYHGETFGLHHDTFEGALQEGANELLVRFVQVGERACRQQFALRLSSPVNGVNVQIPTANVDIKYRNKLEAAFDLAYVDRDVFTRDEMIAVYWPDALDFSDNVTIRVQTPSGRIYAESEAWAAPGETSALVYGHNAPQGALLLRFMPQIKFFYDDDLRVLREIPIWGMGVQPYSDSAYGTYRERRVEALQHAMSGNDLFAEMAKMALGQWQAVEPPTVLQAIEIIHRRDVDWVLCLVGLLGIAYRWGEHDNFPPSLRQPFEECILNSVEAWGDEAGCEGVNALPQSTRFLLHTGEILAGQLYPDRVFPHSGQTGQWHRERGERLALDWLRQRGMRGFAEWDSARAFEAVLVALAHLMDLSETEAIWQMVTVIMDKLLFTIALSTYQGVFGATQGVADVTSIKGGLLSPMAGITRLLWGEGVFNQHRAGIVSAACMEDYELPPLVTDVARHQAGTDTVWNREGHVLDAGEVVNKVTYRTPDYLLASVQDYHPGELGAREHIWQATLGPEAVVYTTHPACIRQSRGHVPGFWLGNVVLPRVAQWGDVLLAIYNLPEDDWMGYTHAYFPAYAFDAYVIRENAQGQVWAFARKGEGYVALTASQGLTWMTQGLGAYRELRAYGRDIIWCCQMGRAALDGNFETFQDRVLGQSLKFDGLSVHFQTLRNETLAFGWDGLLLRDGEVISLSGFKHYENPYCVTELDASQMEIKSDQYLMRLKFA